MWDRPAVVTLSKFTNCRRGAQGSLPAAATAQTLPLWLIAAGCARDVWPVGRSRRARTARRGGPVDAVVSERVSGRRPTAAAGEDRVRAGLAAKEAQWRRWTGHPGRRVDGGGRTARGSGVRVCRLQIGRVPDRDWPDAHHQSEWHLFYATRKGKRKSIVCI